MAVNRTLAGKTIFISGGSRGIGLAIALRAARDGANIAIAAKTSEPHPSLPGTISAAARQIEEGGGRALPLVCDIREEEQVEAAVAATVARFGGIDICLNNASADVILTGTPDGVGIGRNPRVYMKPGASLTTRIEGLGSITNKIVDSTHRK